MAETTALGAAMAAGSAEGIEVWDLNNIQPVPCDIFNPLITEDGKEYFADYFVLFLQRRAVRGHTFLCFLQVY
jgi:hypothetical protein